MSIVIMAAIAAVIIKAEFKVQNTAVSHGYLLSDYTIVCNIKTWEIMEAGCMYIAFHYSWFNNKEGYTL